MNDIIVTASSTSTKKKMSRNENGHVPYHDMVMHGWFNENEI